MEAIMVLLQKVLPVFLVLALGVLLLLIGGIRRGVLKSQSRKAMDHLDGANYRDYSTQPKRKHRSEISPSSDTAKVAEKAAEKAPEAEGTAQDSNLMAETLRKLYSNDTPAEAGAAEKAAVSTEETDGSRHRRTKA